MTGTRYDSRDRDTRYLRLFQLIICHYNWGVMLARGARLTNTRLARQGLIATRSVTASVHRAMSSIYVLPIDPTSPQTQATSDVDSAKLWSSVPSGTKPATAGTTRLFFGDKITALSSLGDKFDSKKSDAKRELVRTAVGNGVKKVKEIGDGVHGQQVAIDASADPHAAGEHHIGLVYSLN